MASISSVSGTSSSSSIYGSRNVISGLASGMDTEAMIENAVSGIKARITALGQKRTKVEWQQEAYRSIISKMVGFTDKYTSYSSSTNLFSASFFNSAVVTTTNGANKDLITASGKTSSDISILGVQQLATAARYTVGASALTGGSSDQIQGDVLTWGEQTVSAIDGTMTLKFGSSNTLNLHFSQEEHFTDAKELANAINEKLKDQTISFTSGSSKKASDCIRAEADDSGNITFTDITNDGGNEIKISSMSGNFKKVFGDSENGSTLAVDPQKLTTKQNITEYLAGKSMTFTLDGVTKTLNFDDLLGGTEGLSADESFAKFQENLQTKLNSAFGGGKIQVSPGTNADGTPATSLNFKISEGSSLKISSEANNILGLGKGDATTYLNTGKTLGDLSILDGLEAVKMDENKYTLKTETVNDVEKHYYEDDSGSKIYTDAEGFHLDSKGERLYSFKLNGVEVGQYTKDTALETVMLDINNNTDAGVKVSYSKTTNEFVFNAKETGAGGSIEFDSGLAQKLFGGGSGTDGQDAKFTASINGSEPMTLTRSSNTVDLDGLNVTLNGKFGEYDADDKLVADSAEAVTFTTKSDADKIVNAVKSMVEDYNAMVTEIKEAYSTMPAQKANKSRYEPLTDEDRADMSESAIKAYEEKAKQGILFADSDLSSLYDKLRSAISSTGTDGSYLRSIGISTAYSDGQTTISFDESKLRSALESDPEKVKDAFTKSKDSGSATDGLMINLKNTLDSYARKTGASKGILIAKAGSPLVPTSVLSNSLKSMLDNYDTQIERWETKLSDQIDRYTTKFSRLEQLIAQMNNQSSMLGGLSGSSY